MDSRPGGCGFVQHAQRLCQAPRTRHVGLKHAPVDLAHEHLIQNKLRTKLVGQACAATGQERGPSDGSGMLASFEMCQGSLRARAHAVSRLGMQSSSSWGAKCINGTACVWA